MVRTATIRPAFIPLALLAVVSGGCSNTLTLQIDSDVPIALVQTLPLTVAAYYDDALRNHSYTEDSNERQNWVISSGNSQVAMFDRVLASTFASVIPIAQLPTADAPVASDLIVAPTIQEIQFATPQETFFDFYEAWIRYDVGLLAPDGGLISNWEITAYGKAPKKRFGRRTDGLNEAIGLALRDIGAKLSTGMLEQPVIKQLIDAKQ